MATSRCCQAVLHAKETSFVGRKLNQWGKLHCSFSGGSSAALQAFSNDSPGHSAISVKQDFPLAKAGNLLEVWRKAFWKESILIKICTLALLVRMQFPT